MKMIVKKTIKISNKFVSDHPFIHLTNKNPESIYSCLPRSIKNSIKRINRMISNPENSFNKTYLGIHTLGLVFSTEVKPLNEYGYGLTSWNTIKIYVRCVENASNDYICPDIGCVCKKVCESYSKASAYVQCTYLGFIKDGGLLTGKEEIGYYMYKNL